MCIFSPCILLCLRWSVCVPSTQTTWLGPKFSSSLKRVSFITFSPLIHCFPSVTSHFTKVILSLICLIMQRIVGLKCFSACGHNPYSDVNWSSALNNDNLSRTFYTPLYPDYLLFFFPLSSISVHRSHAHSFRKATYVNAIFQGQLRLVWEELGRKVRTAITLNSNILSQRPH